MGRTSSATVTKITSEQTKSKGRVEMLSVTDENLAGLNEAQILTLMLADYALTHPREHADKAFASALKCNISSINNWKSGKGSPGFENWVHLEALANTDLYNRWCKLKRNRIVERMT
jgi:hypothetical protein